ncbi:hypothetical protein V2J09_013925 [Rumex salicifolius]
MEKPTSSRELECVGRLEVVRPKPVGFLCGSIPVPTDKSFHVFNSDIVPSSKTVSAPRYRLLPTETDLNMPPLVSNLPEKAIPVEFGSLQCRTSGGDLPWEGNAVTSNLTRKGEALAVSGLANYGDEIDVIAPADILKQIFKMPYSRARLSISVHRVGQTLILNAGPDVDEEERALRRGQPKSFDQSLFSNFAMHSVRVEACDCPPSHSAAAEVQPQSSVRSDLSESMVKTFESSHIQRTHEEEKNNVESEYPIPKHDRFYLGSKKKRNKGRDPVKQGTSVGEKSRCSVQESEKYRRAGSDEFLRVLFWQFHNFRMLLGSDLLMFSNDKYVAVSLHLWDVSRQVTPLTWLEAWLDNVMASIPELAICYHENGVVQGYELLKTNDIFLLKGIAEDGTPAFHPYVVQQNGLSVLRFLEENCKRDPGAYWLCKNAGDDAIQLFDLSIIPHKHQSERNGDCSSSLPSLVHQRRSDSLLSLGTLLYRIAHRLSLAVVTGNRARCAKFFRKCLELLDEPDHLIVRAYAHEQFARLILSSCGEELGLTTETYSFESEVRVTDVEEESVDIINSKVETSALNMLKDDDKDLCTELNRVNDHINRASQQDTAEKASSGCTSLIAASELKSNSQSELMSSLNSDGNLTVCNVSPTPQPVDDPISSKLAAVHHVSQAIKNLRWKRQLQATAPGLVYKESNTFDKVSIDFPSCACGDPDCIEVCNIKEWLPTSKLDRKLWKLVLLLGESYLALGKAYMEDSQLNRALKVVEMACSVYGSVPQYLDDSRFISSMVDVPSSKPILDRHQKKKSAYEKLKLKNDPSDDCVTFEDFSLTYLFWAKAWALVGDVHAEVYTIKGKEISSQCEHQPSGKELRMSSDVVEELTRLKKKLSQGRENCSSCSLVNCSCQSDRASSGSNASSSHGNSRKSTHERKQNRKPQGRNTAVSLYEKRKSVSKNDCEDMGRDSGLMGGCAYNSDEDSALSEINAGCKEDNEPKKTNGESLTAKSGGIFRYLLLPVSGDRDELLLSALRCYQEAEKALHGVPAESTELNSVLKKIGWVSNELGRIWLERKDLGKAELAFANAIEAFKEVSDHTNIILINCNLGHGRRALAEELLPQIKYFKTIPIFFKAYTQVLETAKMEYGRALQFYRAAKSELAAILREADDTSFDLRNEVYTQFAHTYLKLGMLLAREDTVAEAYENGSLEDEKLSFHVMEDKRTKEYKKHQISANDSIREALSLYESLGELRRQEAAYAYFQLGCYQRDCCLRFLDPKYRSNNESRSESNTLQRVKQYASLAERNWQRAIEFYSAKSHPHMYLTILTERAALTITLSGAFHSNTMLEIALCCLLEGRHISLKEDKQDILEIQAEFWAQLQTLLKKMLAFTRTPGSSKTVTSSSQSNLSLKRLGDADKLKELYKMSLKSSDFSQLHDMHILWTSSTPRST